MNPLQLVQKLLAEFDALPEKPAVVWLTQYETEKDWQQAPEPIFSFAEAREANLLLEQGLLARGVEVKFHIRGKLEVTFDVANGFPSGGIGWAVLQNYEPR